MQDYEVGVGLTGRMVASGDFSLLREGPGEKPRQPIKGRKKVMRLILGRQGRSADEDTDVTRIKDLVMGRMGARRK